MPNTSGVDHNIAIKGLGAGAVVAKGVSSFKADLKAGTYTYFCEVPGHEAAGMKGTLTVK
jgi:plastocyanin